MAGWYRQGHIPLWTISLLNCDHISKTNVIPRTPTYRRSSIFEMASYLVLSLSSPHSTLQKWERYLSNLRLLRHTTWVYCSLSIKECQLNSFRSAFVISTSGWWKNSCEFQDGSSSELTFCKCYVLFCLSSSQRKAFLRVCNWVFSEEQMPFRMNILRGEAAEFLLICCIIF